MKKIIFTLLITFFIVNSAVYSQSVDIINTKLDSLKKVRDYYQQLLKDIELKIFTLESEKDEILDADSVNVVTNTISNTNLYSTPNPNSEIVGKINANTRINVLRYEQHYFKIVYKKLSGWIDENYLKVDQKVTDLKIQNLIEKYGADIAQDILEEKIWLNMSKEMVVDSWGQPQKVTRSVHTSGISEHWIYSNTYLFFQDGKLIRWQDI